MTSPRQAYFARLRLDRACTADRPVRAAKLIIPRNQFLRSRLVANITRMSLPCHKKIGRVGRRCYENASDLSAASRACRGLWRTRHDTRTNGRHYMATDRWLADQSRARDILARMSRVSTTMSRGCYEETAPGEFRQELTAACHNVDGRALPTHNHSVSDRNVVWIASPYAVEYFT